jgi:protein ImuB
MGRAPEVVVCSRRAAKEGVRPGMPIAEARAIEPRLDVYEEDPAGDLRALKRLAQWAERYSPIVGLEDDPSPQSLLVDITGCAGYFRGEEKLRQRAACEFTEAGWAPRIALADTIGAAWALAHYGGQLAPRVEKQSRSDPLWHGPLWHGPLWHGLPTVPRSRPEVSHQEGDLRSPEWHGQETVPQQVETVPQQGQSRSDCTTLETERLLQQLPVAALRLPADTVHNLAQLGIERIGSLLALPRNEIPARFGSLVLQRLDQALGRQPEVIVPHRTPSEIEAIHSFEYPTDRLEVVTYALDRLTERIQQPLCERNCAARRIECWFYYPSEPPLRLEVGLFRPSRSPQYLGMLLHAQLEQVRLAEPVSALRLHVSAAEPVVDGQAEFFETGQSDGIAGAAALVDCLSSRLGPDAVTHVRMVPDFQPEYACRFEPMIPRIADLRLQIADRKKHSRKIGNPQSAICNPFLRPLRLWPKPVGIEVMSAVPEGPPFQLRWAGKKYRITRSWGPERIETGWWRGQDVRRDYYVVATDVGTRLWIFRRGEDERWFLHGSFD